MCKTQNRKSGYVLMGLLILIVSNASLFLVAHFVATVITLLILGLAYLSLLIRKFRKTSKPLNIIRLILSVTVIVFSVIYLVTQNYYVLITIQTLGSLIGLFEIILNLYTKKSVWKGGKLSKKIGYCAWIFVMAACACGSTFFIKTAINPNTFITGLRLGSCTNSYTAPKSVTKEWRNNYYVTNDIKYSNKYPNSYFDIYSTTNILSGKKPVFIYLHGGGWVYGDKTFGDPNSTENLGYYTLLERMVKEGFTVISVNYALAPEYPYPTPIYQMTDLVKFLREHAAEYGLDTENLALGGGSAGAQTVGQFVAVQTNPEYAKEMGVERVATNGEIKAVYLGCGLLNPSKVTDSNFIPIDYMLYQLIRGYFHAGAVENNENAMQANIIPNVTAGYPPTYITDGNFSTYYKQAHELDNKLTELGVKHTSFILDSGKFSKQVYFHSYDITDSDASKQNLENLVRFLKNLPVG